MHGIHLCECDIALTKDEKLILAHDEDFKRLALDPLAEHSSLKVGDLTYRQLISMPLKSGNRPPLLIDVLRSASAIGGNSQLIIEIKPGNVAAASALARLFLRHPELMSRCAVVMSFDAFAMHALRKDLKTVLPMVDQQGPEALPLPSTSGVSLPSTMSLGNLGYRVDSMPTSGSFEEEKEPMQEDRQFIPLAHRGKTDSLDHFGVGLTDSIRTRSGSFNFTPFNQFEPQAPQQPHRANQRCVITRCHRQQAQNLQAWQRRILDQVQICCPLQVPVVQQRRPSFCCLLVVMPPSSPHCLRGVLVCQSSCC